MNAQPQKQLTDFERDILLWLCKGEKSKAAETIALTLLGVTRKVIFKKNFCVHVPKNADDFRTCHLLLVGVTGAREQLYKLKKLGRVWKNIIENWEKLEKLYQEERLQGKQPKLNALLQDLNKRAVV